MGPRIILLLSRDFASSDWKVPITNFSEILKEQNDARRYGLGRIKDTAYHIDYAFLSRPLLSKLRSVVIGRCDDWLSLSDHAPVLVELDL